MNNIVNVSHLFEFLEFNGSEYGISKFDKSFLHDTISANSSAFRLYFDANYQDGYRHKIKPKFDKDTGEILEDKGEQKWAMKVLLLSNIWQDILSKQLFDKSRQFVILELTFMNGGFLMIDILTLNR